MKKLRKTATTAIAIPINLRIGTSSAPATAPAAVPAGPAADPAVAPAAAPLAAPPAAPPAAAPPAAAPPSAAAPAAPAPASAPVPLEAAVAPEPLAPPPAAAPSAPEPAADPVPGEPIYSGPPPDPVKLPSEPPGALDWFTVPPGSNEPPGLFCGESECPASVFPGESEPDGPSLSEDGLSCGAEEGPLGAAAGSPPECRLEGRPLIARPARSAPVLRPSSISSEVLLSSSLIYSLPSPVV